MGGMTVAILLELSRRPGGTFGIFTVTLLCLLAVAAPMIAPYSPNAIAPANRLMDPSWQHLLGTDHLGRDILSRLIFGSRVALGISLSVIAISLTTGVVLGVAAALSSRAVDLFVVGVFDIVTSFPSIILALALVAVFGPGLGNVVLLVSGVFIPHFGRVARAQTIAIRNSPFIEAERVLGAERWRIILHHVTPNIIGPIFVLACMDIPVVITIEAGLSFLGLGVRPPLASWGNLLNDGYTYLDQSAWLATFSGLSLILATLGFALLGEALRDTLDPKLRKTL
jgi:peptide/nickel transport system permease protein